MSSCWSMFRIQGNQSLPVSLPKTFELELRCRLPSSTSGRCRHARICMTSTHHSDVQVTYEETLLTSTRITNSGWIEFSKNVSGEWDGFGATFMAEGLPIELPDSVVPDAYKEWEVKVFDWQTQCPTLAQFNLNCPYFIYKTIKLLPTVGCEADAATRYSIQERIITAPHHSAFAYHSSGCYVAVWSIADNTIKSVNKVLELEHSLIDPRDKESRVRVIQVLGLHGSELTLQNIKVFVEQWYGPFRNGDQLGGCSIRSSAFAATQSLNASQVTGFWQGINVAATFHNPQNMIQELANEHVRQSTRDEADLILLPKNLWSSVKRMGNEETYCEVGWSLDHGRAITSKCTFSSTAEVKEIAMAATELQIRECSSICA